MTHAPPRKERNRRLLFGPLAAAILAFGVIGLALTVPGYSQVRQTVSEIGEVGSPARIPFAITLCCVAACLLVFASGVREASVEAGHGQAAAVLIGLMAVSVAGVGVFAFPHPLHNVFGTSELIGYQAPLALALAWRGDPRARRLVRFSGAMFAIVWICLALNLASLDRDGWLFASMKPVYGLVQRSLFAAWFCWCAVASALLRECRPAESVR
jgi:hypothetical membrane protein